MSFIVLFDLMIVKQTTVECICIVFISLDRFNQRVKNNTVDMAHAHKLQGRLRPEMSVKPSHLWHNRTVSVASLV